jgi:molybdenum cofactor cytidylyltransferase
MGTPKQLLEIGGKPLVRHCLDTLTASGIADIVVVLGDLRHKIGPVICDLPIKMVANPAAECEMAESVRVGLGAVDSRSSGVLICLTDHPFVAVETYRQIVEAHFTAPMAIVIPTYQERRGHPSLFPRDLIHDLFSGGNLRDIIHAHPGKVGLLPVDDPETIRDIDTMDDYERVRVAFRERKGQHLHNGS